MDPFAFLGDDDLDESDSSSGEDCYVATKESSKDLAAIQKSRSPQAKQASRVAKGSEPVRLVQTPDGLQMSSPNRAPNSKLSKSSAGYDTKTTAPASK